MSIFGIMSTSVAGMSAQTTALDALGENMSNSNTTGYKTQGVDFSTLFPSTDATAMQSGSVQASLERDVSAQGAIASTGVDTNMAINGNGFFVVQDPSGATALTRDGSFTENSNGNLVNDAGFTLLGYNLVNGTANTTVNGSTGLAPVNISSMSFQAIASTSGSLAVNLPSTATAVGASSLPSTNSSSAQYTEKTSMVAYDHLGNADTLDVYFTNTGSNTWEATVYSNADASSSGTSLFPYSSGPLVTEQLTFDPTTGSLASGSATSLSVPIPNGNTVSIDLAKTTQFASAYSVQSATIDGNAASAVKSVQIGADGTLSAVYADGVTTGIYKVPLASVASPDNLAAESGNAFLPTETSGAMIVSGASTGSNGSIVSGSLEQSTVDLSTTLTELMTAQQSYAANSKVFQTGQNIMDTLLNLHS